MVQTGHSNGGSSKSEMQRHGRMVSDEVDGGSFRRKSVQKGNHVYTLIEPSGAVLTEAFTNWNGRFVWTTRHTEEYTAKKQDTIQYEDFD